MIYHGVTGKILERVDHQPHVRYSAGAMLLDIDDPRTIVNRSTMPILVPETDEERTGIVPNVVFPTGVDVRENGRVDIYYGIADAGIGVARLNLPLQIGVSRCLGAAATQYISVYTLYYKIYSRYALDIDHVHLTSIYICGRLCIYIGACLL